MKSVLLLLGALVTVRAESVAAQQSTTQPFSVGETITIHSAVLNEDRKIYVYDPDDASENRLPAYPVLYLFDEGDMAMVAGMVRYLSASNEQIPAMIVVGIDGSWTRIRDLTPTHSLVDNEGKVDSSADSWLQPSGGGDRFLQFVRQEVMPYVQQHYHAAPFTILDGHSVGGLAAMHALLTQPQMFNAYIAIAPSLWWGRGSEVALAKAKLSVLPNGKRFLFVADSPESGPFSRYVSDFEAILKAKAPPGLAYRHTFYATETHGSIAAKAHYDGIRFVFPQWDIASTDTTAALIERHYRRIAERLGVPLQPPLGMVRDWGAQFLNRPGHLGDAIALFRLNAANFPAVRDVYTDLGDGYARKGDKANAVVSYEQALKLDPGNAEISAKLQSVQGTR